MLGPQRDRLREHAAARGREELDKAKGVMEAGRESARQEAEAQGLSPGGLEQRAKEAEDKAVRVAEAAEKGAEAERERQKGKA
jgi:hypothetical protein